MLFKIFVLVCFSYITVADCSKAPFITKCKSDDANCMKESAQSVLPMFAGGIPEVNVESLDPLTIKEVDSSTSNLKFVVSDLVVTNLKECEVKHLEYRAASSSMNIKVLCKPILDGKYVMKGQLFVVPIEGNGGLHVVTGNVLFDVDVDIINKEGKDGKVHWTIKRWKHTFDLQDKSVVKFENLFPDNELLRKTTEELIATNGNDVINEIGSPVIKAVISKIVDNVAKFFKMVPLEDMILNP